jgi:hypothetical protein
LSAQFSAGFDFVPQLCRFTCLLPRGVLKMEGEAKMRLTQKLAGEATAELLSILSEYSSGLRTSELSGTRRFHGERTLRNRQIIRLLRESGKAEAFRGGHGIRTFYFWKLANKR